MIKKLVLLIVIIISLYWVSVFTMPEISAQIDKLIWMPGLSDNLKWTKDKLEGAITNIPSVEEFKSWALDAKNMFIDGVDTTKETIDTIREGAQKAEETYNEAKETFDDAKQVFEDASEKFEQIQDVVDSVKNVTGTGS